MSLYFHNEFCFVCALLKNKTSCFSALLKEQINYLSNSFWGDKDGFGVLVLGIAHKKGVLHVRCMPVL